MFEFIKERKAAAALDLVVERLPGTLASCSGMERCAARAVANAMLLAGVGDYGRDFAHAPMKLDPIKAFDAVSNLADRHRQKCDAGDSLSGRPAHDPVFSAYKWEMLAIETVMVTIGCSIHGDARSSARTTWESLKKVGMHADDAVRALQIYAKAYSIDPVPMVSGRKIDKAYLVSLASHLPPMFRPKKK